MPDFPTRIAFKGVVKEEKGNKFLSRSSFTADNQHFVVTATRFNFSQLMDAN